MPLYERPLADLAGIRACADEHGFCLVRGVFTGPEIAAIKEGVRLSHEMFSGNIPDVMSCPPLRGILLDPRVLSLARALLGDDLVYYPETAVNYEATVGPMTLKPYAVLHCDAVGMPDNTRTFWRSATNALYRGYRFGLYLQDYEHHSGGLKLCAGTHRGDAEALIKKAAEPTGQEIIDIDGTRYTVPKIDFPIYDVPSRPGDIVIWSLRTIHAAGVRRLRGAPGHAFHPEVENSLEAQIPQAFCPIPGPRLTIFFDYAAPCEEIDLYIKTRTSQFDDTKFRRFINSRHDKTNLIAEARRHGVRMRFDFLIAVLATGLIRNIVREPKDVAARILAMADQHEEFSPYFPLFDRARYQAARAQDETAALQVVLDGVTRHLEGLRAKAAAS